MECLNNIIGLSETTCPCFDTGKPTDFNTSKSGIFLDQLDGFNIELAQAADDCGKGGIWDRALTSIRNATNDYINNFMGCIGQNYKPRITPLNVTLGETTYQGSLNYTQNFAGQQISPMQIKGGVILLKRIGVIVNNSVPVTVRVYSNVPSSGNQSTLIYQTPPINANANIVTWAALAQPLELPMYSNEVFIKYYIVYALDGTYQPKDNKKDCGCGGRVQPWLQWLDSFGTIGNDATNVNGFTNTAGANGLALDIQIKCRTRDIICSDEYPLDFTDDSYALNIAYAIRFRAAATLYEDLLNTGKINRFTLLDRDYVQRKITEWNTSYMDWVNYVCASINLDKNECLTCRTNNPTSLIRTNINTVQAHFDWITSSPMQQFNAYDFTNGNSPQN